MSRSATTPASRPPVREPHEDPIFGGSKGTTPASVSVVTLKTRPLTAAGSPAQDHSRGLDGTLTGGQHLALDARGLRRERPRARPSPTAPA